MVLSATPTHAPSLRADFRCISCWLYSESFSVRCVGRGFACRLSLVLRPPSPLPLRQSKPEHESRQCAASPFGLRRNPAPPARSDGTTHHSHCLSKVVCSGGTPLGRDRVVVTWALEGTRTMQTAPRSICLG